MLSVHWDCVKGRYIMIGEQEEVLVMKASYELYMYLIEGYLLELGIELEV